VWRAFAILWSLWGISEDVTNRGAAVVLAGVVFSMTGCSTAAGAPETVADDFYTALAASDWSGACALLAPQTRSELEQSAGTPCAEALAGEDLPDPGALGSSSRYGTMAQTRFSADTVFLGRFGDRWKVVAAGCAPVPGRPYDCRVEGG
jgi:hypothetical protein